MTAAPALAGYPSPKRFFDKSFEAYAVKICPGEFYVSTDASDMLVTVLGSCVSACIRDPYIGIGGMNHFMLPESESEMWGGVSAASRFGNFAMEQMINELLKKGALKNRLEIKVFGGGKILKDALGVGEKNAAFVQQYCKEEGLKIAASSLGGTAARRIHYFPSSGKVMQRFVPMVEGDSLVQEEKRAAKMPAPAGDVELFV